MFLIFVGICILIYADIWYETHTFKVTKYSITSSKLDMKNPTYRIVVLSDLHNKIYGDNNEDLISAIRKQEPKIIIIAGDMLIGKEGTAYDVALEFVKEITKICRVYYTNGNHEQRMKEQPQKFEPSYEEYRKELHAMGVIMLDDKSYILDMGCDLAVVTGLEIPKRYYEKFTNEKLTVEEIQDKVGKAEKDCYQILVAHNPVHAKGYSQWGADLVISGHLHGGIIRVPLFGGVITPQAQIFPRYSGGHYKVGSTDVIVSKGLGDHTVKVRLFNRAEIVVLELHNQK